MADSKGRPIIRPREIEAERILKRREWLMGLAEDPDKDEVGELSSEQFGDMLLSIYTYDLRG